MGKQYDLKKIKTGNLHIFLLSVMNKKDTLRVDFMWLVLVSVYVLLVVLVTDTSFSFQITQYIFFFISK